jgi:predicted NBD/HSP70 family sugar kinase
MEKVYVGLDIGGTTLLVASADGQGRIGRRVQRPTPVELDAGLDALHGMIAEVAGGRPIAGIGAAIGGPLDWRTGVVSPLHQPQWRDVPLRRIMEDRWSCRFGVDVDTNVAALGEYRFGGQQAARFLYLTLSTGMGGGFLIDGRVYRGAGGAHPEAAHQAVAFRCRHPDKVHCECGAPDCLEALVSGNAVRRIYGRCAEELTEEEWAEVSYNLGQGLRNLAALYAPDVIVLGGGLAVGRGSRLLDAAGAVMRDHLRIVPAPALRLSRLGYDTALMGAIAVAIHGLE